MQSEPLLAYPVVSSEKPITINVRALTGLTKTVLVDPNATVFQLKQAIEAHPDFGVTPMNQRLIFCGRELQDQSKISDPPFPLRDGDVVQIFLRPIPQPMAGPGVGGPQQPVLAQAVRGGPYGGPPQGQAYGGVEANDALNLYAISAAVARDSAFTRLLGNFYLLAGLVYVIIGSTNGFDWATVVIGALLLVLGMTALRAALSRATPAVVLYLRALVIFVIAAAAILIGHDVSGNAQSVIITVIVSILLPVFLCSVCLYSAQRFVLHCQERDQVDLALRAPEAVIIHPDGAYAVQG